MGGLPGTDGVERQESTVGASVGALRSELLTTGPVPMLLLTGGLGYTDGVRACQWMVDALADSPPGLVVDLDGISVDGNAGHALLPVAGHVKAWPERPFALCRRPATLRPPAVPIFPSRELAVQHVQGATVRPQRFQQLERTAAASQDARRLVTRACAEWRLENLTPSAQLVITELVNNAVVHTGDHFLVTITLTDEGVHLAVRDTSRAAPRVRPPDEVGVNGGKGMTLIDAFASAWGFTMVGDGKVVWAELSE